MPDHQPWSMNRRLLPVQPTAVSRPSDVVSRATWISQLSLSRDLWGNAVGIVTRLSSRSMSIELLDPRSVEIEETGVGQLPVVTYDGERLQRGEYVIFPSTYSLPGT